MAAEHFVIKVEGVSKNFKLPHQKVSTLKSAFIRMISRGDRSIETQHALKDINIEVKQGEFFGIVGRNGSGKSTLLKILAGIYQPTTGAVHTTGKLVPFIELGVGFNPELTGRENIYLNGALLGFSSKEIDRMYEGIVEFAELEAFMDQKLKNYSSGMQVRLAFSLATRSEADILLVDEVLAVGDADFQRKCFDYFKQLKKQGTTVVFVTHDMSAVREYCDRAILIEKTKIIAEGDVEKITELYTKLFNVPLMEQVVEREDRWGNGEAVFAAIDVMSAPTDEMLRISMKIHANQKVTNPVVGFMIKSSDGASVLGTNTTIKKTKLDTIAAGKDMELEWAMPNVLSDGAYLVTGAVMYADGVTVTEWWEDAVRFRVSKDERTPYHITPNIELTVR